MTSTNVFSTWIGWFEITLILILSILYVYYSWISVYVYWKRRKVPYLKPSFPFGNFKDVFLMKKNFHDSWLDVYTQLGNLPYGGIFSVKSPMLVIKDPELIKLILTKDFSHFTDHGWIANSAHEPLLNNLFNMVGENWKKARNKLTPAFTNRKMKMIFPIMNDCAQQVKLAMEKIILQKGGTFEAKDLMTRYTLDVIVNCAFGLSTTSVSNPDCEVYKIGKGMYRKSFTRTISNIVLRQSPKLYSLLKLHFLDYDACERFAKLIIDTVTYREKNNVVRYDILDLLIRLKNHLTIEDNDMFPTSDASSGETNGCNENQTIADGITETELLSHALVSFFAGFEGTSTALAICLFELSRRPDLQAKIQTELDEALELHGGFTYQMIHELLYLDRVFNETLRRYPPLEMLDRVCVKTYRIPDTDVIIEKGCKIIIPTYAIHHDPKYYPGPFEFDPDRFLEENVKSRPKYTYLPFGDGPRVCIGTKLAKITMQLVLATFFSEFDCKLNPKTPVPLTIACGEVVTTTNDPIVIDVRRRNRF